MVQGDILDMAEDGEVQEDGLTDIDLIGDGVVIGGGALAQAPGALITNCVPA